jgi:hypothetical protein
VVTGTVGGVLPIVGTIGFAAGFVNGADGGNADGVVTGLVTAGAVGAEVEGVGNGNVVVGSVEGAGIGVGKGFKEGIGMVGFVDGTVMIVGDGFVDGTVIGIAGLVT